MAPSYDGELPRSGLTLGTDGNFYGSASRGGKAGYGALYKITSSGTETVIYSFCTVSCNDGFSPTTPLVQHTNGDFYGTTSGNSLGGSIFYSLAGGLAPFVKLESWSADVGAAVQILGKV